MILCLHQTIIYYIYANNSYLIYQTHCIYSIDHGIAITVAKHALFDLQYCVFFIIAHLYITGLSVDVSHLG